MFLQQFAGCTVDVIQKDLFYSALKTNKVLIDSYVANTKALDVPFNDCQSGMFASTGLGNVSQIKPSIHRIFRIPTEGANHTYAFTKAAVSQKAQPSTLNSAKCMAMTVIDLICNPKLLKDVKENFKKK